MKNRIVVIDGMGGGIGVQLIGKLKDLVDEGTEIIALGTNGAAAERMVRAGAQRGAAGENAVRVSVSQGDFILGPIGIVIPNSMMGEVTAAMAEAILAAPGERILLPLQNDHFYLAGLEQAPLAKTIDKALEILRDRLEKARKP
jgi:NAD(P)-dependent dehydrogenase (short-subunit alcohol dehydrogenase family)